MFVHICFICISHFGRNLVVRSIRTLLLLINALFQLSSLHSLCSGQDKIWYMLRSPATSSASSTYWLSWLTIGVSSTMPSMVAIGRATQAKSALKPRAKPKNLRAMQRVCGHYDVTTCAACICCAKAGDRFS